MTHNEVARNIVSPICIQGDAKGVCSAEVAFSAQYRGDSSCFATVCALFWALTALGFLKSFSSRLHISLPTSSLKTLLLWSKHSWRSPAVETVDILDLLLSNPETSGRTYSLCPLLGLVRTLVAVWTDFELEVLRKFIDWSKLTELRFVGQQ